MITFSLGCPHAKPIKQGGQSWPRWQSKKGVRVLWLSRDPVAITRDYCLKQGIRLSDTLAEPTYRTYLQLGLARVPNTMLVGTNGTVEKVCAGRLEQTAWDNVFANFRR